MPKPPEQIPVPPKLAREMLNATGLVNDGEVPQLLGDALEEARQRLEHLTGLANTRVSESEVAGLAASALAREKGYKGHPELKIGSNGDVYVKLYSSRKRRNKTSLPPLKEIQRRARSMGVPKEKIKEFGMKRRFLWEYLQDLEVTSTHRTQEQPAPGPDEVTTLPHLEKPKKGFVKTSVAIKQEEVDIDALLTD